MNKVIIFILISFSGLNFSLASGNHGYKEKQDHKDEHDVHSNEDKHEQDEDHHEHDGEAGSKAIGKNKAIISVDDVKGFQLSKEAIQTLKLKLQTVNGSELLITKNTLVTSKGTKGIYRFRAGFFKFLPVVLKKEDKGMYFITVKELGFGDQIVVDGVDLLRVADVYSQDKSEYGHSH